MKKERKKVIKKATDLMKVGGGGTCKTAKIKILKRGHGPCMGPSFSAAYVMFMVALGRPNNYIMVINNRAVNRIKA